MQVNATAFLTEQNLPLQRIAPYFELSQRRKSETPDQGNNIDAPVSTRDLDQLKSTLAEHNITLKFSRDENTRAIVVEMVDDRTGEAILQIPSTVSLKLAAHFVKLQGQFIDKQQ